MTGDELHLEMLESLQTHSGWRVYCAGVQARQRVVLEEAIALDDPVKHAEQRGRRAGMQEALDELKQMIRKARQDVGS